MVLALAPRGILIAIEGIDGAGKTTQAGLLADRIRAAGADVVQSKEPTNGTWGARLRQSAATGRLAPEEELQLFLEDRREHVANLITPALQAGAVVLLDRYYLSTVAYQGARGMNPDELLLMNEEFAPIPDLLLILDVPAAVGVARIAGRGDIGNTFEKLEDLERSAAIFAGVQRHYVARIDGTLPRDQILEAVLAELYLGPFFQRLCAKRSYKDECEPAHCLYREAGQCRYPEVGSLARRAGPQPMRRLLKPEPS